MRKCSRGPRDSLIRNFEPSSTSSDRRVRRSSSRTLSDKRDSKLKQKRRKKGSRDRPEKKMLRVRRNRRCSQMRKKRMKRTVKRRMSITWENRQQELIS